MITVNVLLTGKLATNGYAQSHTRNADRTYTVEVEDNGNVADVSSALLIDPCLVAMATINGRKCPLDRPLKSGDRVMLVPSELAPLWRYTQPTTLWTDTVLSLLVSELYNPDRLA